jgi:hypothetical protein
MPHALYTNKGSRERQRDAPVISSCARLAEQCFMAAFDVLSVRPELLCRIRAVIVKGLSLMLAKQARGAPCAPGSVYKYSRKRLYGRIVFRVAVKVR